MTYWEDMTEEQRDRFQTAVKARLECLDDPSVYPFGANLSREPVVVLGHAEMFEPYKSFARKYGSVGLASGGQLHIQRQDGDIVIVFAQSLKIHGIPLVPHVSRRTRTAPFTGRRSVRRGDGRWYYEDTGERERTLFDGLCTGVVVQRQPRQTARGVT